MWVQGIVIGSNWTCCTVEKSVCRRTRLFDTSTEDAKIILVVWSSQDQPTVSHRRSSWTRGTRRHLNACAIHQHCVLAASIFTYRNC